VIAGTNIEEQHAAAIARYPVLHPPSRSARRRGDMRWRFNAFLSAMAREAAAAGVSRSVLDSAFAGLTLDGAVLAFDRRQRGTFRKSFEEYAATRVIPTRIKRAKQLMQRHAALLARIERHSECRLRCSWPSGLSKATTAPAIWASCP